MEVFIEYLFRFAFYTFFGLVLEMTFSVHNIDIALGYKVHRRVPRKYLEGFVSMYMIPLHGLGLLFGFEFVHSLIGEWFIVWRFFAWAVMISVMEVFWGVLCHKVLGFYSWDYYADSKYKVFKNGYTLWTLVPLWGVAGLVLEWYSRLLIHISPSAVEFVVTRIN